MQIVGLKIVVILKHQFRVNCQNKQFLYLFWREFNFFNYQEKRKLKKNK